MTQGPLIRRLLTGYVRALGCAPHRGGVTHLFGGGERGIWRHLARARALPGR